MILLILDEEPEDTVRDLDLRTPPPLPLPLQREHTPSAQPSPVQNDTLYTHSLVIHLEMVLIQVCSRNEQSNKQYTYYCLFPFSAGLIPPLQLGSHRHDCVDAGLFCLRKSLQILIVNEINSTASLLHPLLYRNCSLFDKES